MKKITYILTILLLSIIPLNSAEKRDCSDLNKFSKAFVTCKSKNIKNGIVDTVNKTGNDIKIGIVDTVNKTGNNIKDYQKKAWSKKD